MEIAAEDAADIVLYLTALPSIINASLDRRARAFDPGLPGIQHLVRKFL